MTNDGQIDWAKSTQNRNGGVKKKGVRLRLFTDECTAAFEITFLHGRFWQKMESESAATVTHYLGRLKG